MAKRLTDSEKWEDPWFLDLIDEHKLLWIYILDKCDHAGIWKVNKRLAEFCFSHSLKWDTFLPAVGSRIKVLSGGEKWFIPKFLRFQYGALNERNKMFKTVSSTLQKEGLQMEDLSPINGGKRKVKDKVKVKEQYSNKGDEKFLEALKTNEAYKGLDFASELGKMDAWLLANPGRVKTRRFIVRWLNRAKPLVIASGAQKRPSPKVDIKKLQDEMAPPPAEWQRMVSDLARKKGV